MTASEFAFMALGLILGGASGAALVFVIGSRPPPPREIRLTVGQDAIPRRVPATLSTDGLTTASAEPARGGPADRRSTNRAGAPVFAGSAPAVAAPAVHAAHADLEADPTPHVPIGVPAVLVTSTRVGIPIHREADPAMAEILGRALVGAVAIGSSRGSADRRADAAEPETRAPQTAAALLDPERRPVAAPAPGSASEQILGGLDGQSAGTAAGSGSAAARDGSEARDRAEQRLPDPADPCAPAEATAEDCCRQADVARLGAERAAEDAAAAQRGYDELRTRADSARAASDPRALQELKETARTAFRAQRRSARDRAELDAAARTWLTTINRLNVTARDAAKALVKAEAAALDLLPTVERLTAVADAARVASEGAAQACLRARSALADCRELAAGDRRAAETMERLAAAPVATGTDAWQAAEPGPLPAEGGTPVVVRIVKGDRDARSRVAAALLRDHGTADTPWADLLAEFADGVRLRAVEESLIDLPAGHPFWGQFTAEERREVVGALSALGYRYDGQGGWLDGRMPNQRDLSRAVGYAGQDPMRVRNWPDDSDMSGLLRDASVAAGEYLRAVGGELSLGEVVDMLGARADPLTGLWDAWETVRPLLLEPADDPRSV